MVAHHELVRPARLHKGTPGERADAIIGHIVDEVDAASRTGRGPDVAGGADVSLAAVVADAHVVDVVCGEDVVWVTVCVEFTAVFVSCVDDGDWKYMQWMIGKRRIPLHVGILDANIVFQIILDLNVEGLLRVGGGHVV